MALSEFKYNKKRKHYAYLFKAIGFYRKNILLSTKPFRIWKGKSKKNVRLYCHPNPNSLKSIYIIPIVYIDLINCFDQKSLKWRFHVNDKRKVKRIKKHK